MKILGICGSPRSKKASYTLMQKAMEGVHQTNPHIETEIIELAGLQIAGCTACGFCRDKLECSIQDDFIPLIEKLKDPKIRGFLFSTPVYMGSMSSQLKAFLDRSVMFRRNNFLFKDKTAGILAVGGSRNGGQEITIQAVQAALLIHDMIVLGDGKPTAHFGGAGVSRPAIEKDAAGLETAWNLGCRVAEVTGMLSKK